MTVLDIAAGKFVQTLRVKVQRIVAVPVTSYKLVAELIHISISHHQTAAQLCSKLDNDFTIIYVYLNLHLKYLKSLFLESFKSANSFNVL